MTADNSNETSGQDQASTTKSRGRKPARKRSTASRGGAAKRGRSQANQDGASRSSNSRSSRSGSSAGRSQASSSRSGSRAKSSRSGIGARLLAGAGRAIPLASGGFGGERMVQRMADERPYMLGAIGLGIGAMIGLMLPGTLSSLTRGSGRGRNSR